MTGILTLAAVGLAGLALGYAAGADLKQPQYECERCGVWNRDGNAKTATCYKCGHESTAHEWANGLGQGGWGR